MISEEILTGYLINKTYETIPHYKEGIYNDNRLVEDCVTIINNEYNDYLDIIMQDINMKIVTYLDKHNLDNSMYDYIGMRYIDWAFSLEHMYKLRDVVDMSKSIYKYERWNKNKRTFISKINTPYQLDCLREKAFLKEAARLKKRYDLRRKSPNLTDLEKDFYEWADKIK